MVSKRYIRDKIRILADFQIILTEEQIEHMRSLNEEYEVDQYAHQLIMNKDWDRIVEVNPSKVKKAEFEVRRRRLDLQRMIADFVDSGSVVRKIDISKGCYKSILHAYSCIHSTCKRSEYPVTCTMRLGELYFVRTDM